MPVHLDHRQQGGHQQGDIYYNLQVSLLRYPDNADYVTAIKELHQPLGDRKLHTSWVKGHQEDNTADYKKLLDAI
jgi:hypothetical protein